MKQDYLTFNEEAEADLELGNKEAEIKEHEKAMRELENQQILVQARNIVVSQINQGPDGLPLAMDLVQRAASRQSDFSNSSQAELIKHIVVMGVT